MGLQIDLTELFEPEFFLERIQCIRVEQNKCGARIYDAKICRNQAAFPNSIKSRKVKGKDEKNLFSVQKY